MSLPSIFYAARDGDTDSLSKILRSGTAADIRDVGRRTPLMFAAGNARLAAVRLLIEHRADPNATETASGWSPLFFAAGDDERSDERRSVIGELITAGGNPNQVDKFRWTPLLEATERSSDSAVFALIEGGANINAKDNDGATPLLHLFYHGRKECIERLLKIGPEVNVVSRQGWFPLLSAVQGGAEYEGIVKTLISLGADINMLDGEGRRLEDHCKCETIMKILKAGNNPIAKPQPKAESNRKEGPSGTVSPKKWWQFWK